LGADSVLDHVQMLILLTQIVDIADDAAHPYDQQEKQEINIDGSLL